MTNPAEMTDSSLLHGLHEAQQRVAQTSDGDERHEAWQEVIALMRELERRFPPSTEPLSP